MLYKYTSGLCIYENTTYAKWMFGGLQENELAISNQLLARKASRDVPVMIIRQFI